MRRQTGRHPGNEEPPRDRFAAPLEFIIAPGNADDSKTANPFSIARNGRMSEKTRMTLSKARKPSTWPLGGNRP